MRVSLVVLIPAYNEELVIGKTIQSILTAGILPQEIYVINDASKDRTQEIAEGFEVNVINNKINLGKAGGITNALRIILSDVRHKDLTHVCFMDADTLVDLGYFLAVRNRLLLDIDDCEKVNKNKLKKLKKPISVLCGRVKSLPHNWLTAFRAYEHWQAYAIHKIAQSKLKTITVAPGCASTYSVGALEGVTWTDETATEDMDATIQVAVAGGIIEYEKNAVVYTQDPNTIQDYLGQIGGRWYPGTWQVMGKHQLLWRGVFSLFHWECRFMVLEPIVYISTLIYLSVWHSERLPWIFGVSSLVVIFLASIAFVRERRFDILKYSPIFPFILFTNLLVFVGKSGNIFGRRKKALKWYSPERYAVSQEKLM